mgnify:FL=1
MTKPAMNSAEDIEAQAALWLQRRRYWNWTDCDQAELENWLEESMAHYVAYWRLDAGLGRAERLAALQSTPSESNAGEPAKRRREWLFPALLCVAATLVIAVAVGLSATYLMRPKDRIYSTPIGGHETVHFSDGSQIELNTNTVLRTHMTSDQRVVWLERGEAYFQVKHDAMHPFIVIAGDRRITDLGTAFVVRRDPGKLKVAVVQGRVWLDEPNKLRTQQSAMLTAGDVATATATVMSVRRDTARDISGGLTWRQGVLVFKYARLADAAAEFNRYNRQKLVIADPSIAKLTIYGAFPTGNVELFSRVVRDVLGLQVRNTGQQIVISR